MDGFQDVETTSDFLDVRARTLIGKHPVIRDALIARPILESELAQALGLATEWFALLKPRVEGEEGAKQVNQTRLVRDGEVLVGQLMHLRAALNAHTRFLIMDDRVERDGISYDDAAASWEKDDEALSRMLEDFICITVTGRKPDLHVKAVVEIMAGFWKSATGSDITQAFDKHNEPTSPAAHFICEVLEYCAGEGVRHLRSSVETQMKKYIAALPEDVKRSAREARAARTQEKRDAGKVKKKALRDAEKAGLKGLATPC